MSNNNKIIGFFGGKFLPMHQGHLHAILDAAGKCDELHVILFHNIAEERKWVSRSKFPAQYLTPAFRETVIRAELKNYPFIKVHSIDSMVCSMAARMSGETVWQMEAHEVIAKIGKVPNLVFSSEPSYEEDFKACYEGCEHVLIDVDRDLFPMSGTEMRRDGAYKHWDFVPKTYKKFLAKSVLILGTESCGKSTLTEKLAHVFNTSFVEEYGRTLCEEYGTGQPPIEVYKDILYGHKVLEKKARESANKVYFIDTEAVVTKFYAQLYEENDLPLADAIAKEQEYDLILYLKPSNRWVDDGMRIHGEQGVREANDKRLIEMVCKMHDKKKIYFLNGTYEENYLNAIKLVKGVM